MQRLTVWIWQAFFIDHFLITIFNDQVATLAVARVDGVLDWTKIVTRAEIGCGRGEIGRGEE